jgi:hypothetical protein
MNINGKSVSLRGMTFTEIGKLLQEASPKKDGLGLTVKLTEHEEEIFCSQVGLKVGYAISDLIADHVKVAGGDPSKISYVYSNRVFRT